MFQYTRVNFASSDIATGEILNSYKRQAAHAACECLKSSMKIGLGTGSTVQFILEKISEKVRNKELGNILCVASSHRTLQECLRLKIPMAEFNSCFELDVTLDGADEIDPALNLVKGGGGALLREKILAQNSARLVIAADFSKNVDQLGSVAKIPLEVLPFCWGAQKAWLKTLGVAATLRTNSEGSPSPTDQQNFILDCSLQSNVSVSEFAQLVSQRSGIVEHGLFLEFFPDVYIAGPDGIQILKRNSPSPQLPLESKRKL